MQSRTLEESPRYLVGMSSGALVLIFFAILWATFSLAGLNEQAALIVEVTAGVVTLALLAFGITTLRAARRLPMEEMSPEDQASGKKTHRRFNIICALEFGAIAVAVVVLRLFQHPEAIAPMTCLIVGLHFLPLAPLFHVRIYTMLGIAVSILGAVALLALLFNLTLGGLYTWATIVGLGTVAIFWLTALSILVKVRRSFHLFQQSSEGAIVVK